MLLFGFFRQKGRDAALSLSQNCGGTSYTSPQSFKMAEQSGTRVTRPSEYHVLRQSPLRRPVVPQCVRPTLPMLCAEPSRRHRFALENPVVTLCFQFEREFLAAGFHDVTVHEHMDKIGNDEVQQPLVVRDDELGVV